VLRDLFDIDDDGRIEAVEIAAVLSLCALVAWIAWTGVNAYVVLYDARQRAVSVAAGYTYTT
jgi:hypothetical protein